MMGFLGHVWHSGQTGNWRSGHWKSGLPADIAASVTFQIAYESWDFTNKGYYPEAQMRFCYTWIDNTAVDIFMYMTLSSFRFLPQDKFLAVRFLSQK